MSIDFYYYTSNWTLLITFLSIVCSFRAARNQDKFGQDSLKYIKSMSTREVIDFHDNLKTQALHHLLYSTSILLNLWQTGIYWIFLHSHKTSKLNEYDHWHQLMHLHVVHILPALACFLNSMLTNCVLKKELWKIFNLPMALWVFIDIY